MSQQAQIAIPATYMRGGTSKGVFFRLEDLPEACRVPGRARDCLFQRCATQALDRAGIAWRIAFTSPSLAGLWAAAAAGLGTRSAALAEPAAGAAGRRRRLLRRLMRGRLGVGGAGWLGADLAGLAAGRELPPGGVGAGRRRRRGRGPVGT